MKKRFRNIFMSVLVFLVCFIGSLFIIIPNKVFPLWPSCSPDFEIKQLNASCVAFSPDRRQIAIGHSDGWDLVDFQTREIVDKHRWEKQFISQMCFSPDGEKLLMTNEYKNIILWDIGSKQELFRLDDIGFCRSSGFSSDGTKIIAAVGWDRSTPSYAGIWNIETGKRESIFPTGCIQVDYAPDEKTVILEHYNQIERWDVETGEKINNIAVLKRQVGMVNFSSDGKQMLVGFSQYDYAILIDIESGSTLKEFENTIGSLEFVGLSKNGAFALVGDPGETPGKDSEKRLVDKLPFSDLFHPETYQGGIFVYSTVTGEVVVRLGGYNYWHGFALSADRSIAAGITNGAVCFWDIREICENAIDNME
jgi:WD40 repeat protein